MKSFNLFLLLLAGLLCYTSCKQTQDTDYLLKICNGLGDEIGVECGYVNSKGDTLIAPGKYLYCYTDTLRNFALVLKKDGTCVAIDRNDQELYEVFWYDNGPDYIQEGLFRIKKNEKIGYANHTGEVVIRPQYDCAFPFKNGRAKVAYDCKTRFEGEHSFWESKAWFYIDKTGMKLE